MFDSTGGDFTSITYSLQVGNYTKIGNDYVYRLYKKIAHTLGTASGGLFDIGIALCSTWPDVNWWKCCIKQH